MVKGEGMHGLRAKARGEGGRDRWGQALTRAHARVLDTVARARGGEGHTPGITLMPHLGHSQGCVKPGVGPTLVL